MKTISSNEAPAAIGPYSHAVETNGTIFTSGQIPILPATGELINGGIKEQAEQVIKNLKSVLNSAGSDLDHVVKTVCFLTDMADFTAFNEVYAAHFKNKPARSCVAVRALPKGALVEIEAISQLKQCAEITQ